MAQLFSIGDLSRRTGVKVPTIRYYESMGLISSSARSEGNQRRFGQTELERLSFIRHARDLGFSLENIRELVGLSRDEKQALRRDTRHHFPASEVGAGKNHPPEAVGTGAQTD